VNTCGRQFRERTSDVGGDKCREANRRNERTGQLSDCYEGCEGGKEAGMDPYYLLRTGGETSKLSKPQFASNARPGRELRLQRWASTGLSKSAERRTRGPSPHHHINVHVLQETIQIITNDVWLNPISQSEGLWRCKHRKIYVPLPVLPVPRKRERERESDDGDTDIRIGYYIPNRRFRRSNQSPLPCSG